MKCSDCKYYTEAEAEAEEWDLCNHPRAATTVGLGIRAEPAPKFYTCHAMLAGICKSHKLFKSKELS